MLSEPQAAKTEDTAARLNAPVSGEALSLVSVHGEAVTPRLQEALLLPNVVAFVDFKTLARYSEINKTVYKAVINTPEDMGYWQSMCLSFAASRGLYSRIDYATFEVQNIRKYFFDELWTARNKWCATDAIDTADRPFKSNLQTFRVRVSCRFRPGERGQQGVCLPLHQFLKVKRQMKKASETNERPLLVGEVDPEEFCDPFLGSLMREPVLLTSSGRVCERSVAVQCILRGGRDPFNGSRLTSDMIEPQHELAQQIHEWRQKKSEGNDVRVELGEVRSLINEAAIDPELLEALVEAERLEDVARRAEVDARTHLPHHFNEEENAAQNHEHQEINHNEAVPEVADVPGANAGMEGHLGGNGAALAINRNTGASTAVDDPILNGRPKNGESARVIDVNEKTAAVSMHIPGAGVRPFYYSTVFDGKCGQRTVYDGTARDSIGAALNGYNACILCYGQTGSGKTFTSFGPDGALDYDITSVDNLPVEVGVVIRACAELLKAKKTLSQYGVKVQLTAQFVEIYEEQVTDLLTGQQVAVRRDTGELAGASELPMEGSISEVMEILRVGQARKRFAATAMNDRSSRSHTAFVVQITQSKIAEPTNEGAATETSMLKSQLYLVDLAGSERVKKSKVTGQRMREAVGINSSLLVLGKVIASLVESRSHVPYFESKLTTMLKSAFGGNCRTTAIINCRPDDKFGDETLQSMRFGERCGMISNATKMAATSVESALATIDASLERVRSQLASLEARGKTHLESYQKLANSCQLMERKRLELARASAVKANSLLPAFALDNNAAEAD